MPFVFQHCSFFTLKKVSVSSSKKERSEKFKQHALQIFYDKTANWCCLAIGLAQNLQACHGRKRE